MELILDSLQRRMRAMHSLYEQAIESMDLDHVNHFEREGVLPIAFSLFHITNMIDSSFMLITGTPPIWNDDWQGRVKMDIADHGKHRTVDEMVNQRIGDYDELRLGDPEPDLADDLAARGAKVEAVTGVQDLADDGAALRLVDAARQAFGRIDAATMASGVIVTGKFLDAATFEDFELAVRGC